MKNTLVIATEPTHSLNFLIYLQNIYLNQNRIEKGVKFPYIAKNYELNKEFHSNFNILWSEITQQVSEHITNDLRLFHVKKDLFYERLFVKSEDNYNFKRKFKRNEELLWNYYL